MSEWRPQSLIYIPLTPHLPHASLHVSCGYGGERVFMSVRLKSQGSCSGLTGNVRKISWKIVLKNSGTTWALKHGDLVDILYFDVVNCLYYDMAS